MNNDYNNGYRDGVNNMNGEWYGLVALVVCIFMPLAVILLPIAALIGIAGSAGSNGSSKPNGSWIKCEVDERALLRQPGVSNDEPSAVVLFLMAVAVFATVLAARYWNLYAMPLFG